MEDDSWNFEVLMMWNRCILLRSFFFLIFTLLCSRKNINMNLYLCILNRQNLFAPRWGHLRYFTRGIIVEDGFNNGSLLRRKPFQYRNNGISRLTFTFHRNMSSNVPRLKKTDITRLFSLAKPERWKLTGIKMQSLQCNM